jgi:hypothetical protein
MPTDSLPEVLQSHFPGDFPVSGHFPVQQGVAEQISGSELGPVLMRMILENFPSGTSGNPQNPQLPFADRETTGQVYSLMIPYDIA